MQAQGSRFLEENSGETHPWTDCSMISDHVCGHIAPVHILHRDLIKPREAGRVQNSRLRTSVARGTYTPRQPETCGFMLSHRLFAPVGTGPLRTSPAIRRHLALQSSRRQHARAFHAQLGVREGLQVELGCLQGPVQPLQGSPQAGAGGRHEDVQLAGDAMDCNGLTWSAR